MGKNRNYEVAESHPMNGGEGPFSYVQNSNYQVYREYIVPFHLHIISCRFKYFMVFFYVNIFLYVYDLKINVYLIDFLCLFII